MGLDIYLYRYENFEETRRKEDLHSEFYDKTWEEVDDYYSLSDQEKEAIRNKTIEYALSLGLDNDGSDRSMYEKVEIDHPDYPDHYFKIGYFRSSYNESGINRILKNMDLPTLNEVFNISDVEYYFQPNWQKALENVESLIVEFQKKGAYRVRAVYPEKFGNEVDNSWYIQALEIVKETCKLVLSKEDKEKYYLRWSG